MDTNSSPEKAPSPGDDHLANSESRDENQLPGAGIPSLPQDHMPTETLPAPLGQDSDALEPLNQHSDAKNEAPLSGEQQAPNIEATHQEGANDAVAERPEQDQEANSSLSHIPSLRSFATPSKSLPPLKDIEHITTPKSFGVAKDDTSSRAAFKSSPVQTCNNSIQLADLAEAEEEPYDTAANDTFAHTAGPMQRASQASNPKSAEIEVAAAFLDVDPEALMVGGPDLAAKLAHRAQAFGKLQSDLSFFKLSQEQMNQVQQKKFGQLQMKLETLTETNKSLISENEHKSLELMRSQEAIADLRSENFSLNEKVSESESSRTDSKAGIKIKEHEIGQLNEALGALTHSNAEQGQKISELTRELNDATNENFSFKLQLSKTSNELEYTKNQKEWYESSLRKTQEKYTDLLKRLDSDSLIDSNKISSLKTQNETLSSLKNSLSDQVNQLQQTLEKTKSIKADLETKLEISNSRFTKEMDIKKETIELLSVQLQEKNDRISQLESYADDIKTSSADSLESLQRQVIEREDKIIALEEKLKRAEEALDFELHKETQLPKLAPSAELILQEGNSGISLSTLYTEFNTVKKQLIVEKSQKEKLAAEVQHFIAELNSKKPAIANYRNRISYYEETLKDVLAKMESIRIEKIESEKECIRLRSRLASHEIEISTIKQLSKDLGRQLCFYLIHSKIRDGNEDPLNSSEKKAIDQILAKSGNKDAHGESDTDQLITERLLGFSSIIELQKKNEELTIAVRSLGKQLEEKDAEPHGFEAAAVEEAKEAILTLQSELESLTIKYDAVVKERDMMKSLSGNSLPGDNNADVKILREANADLKLRVKQSEEMFKTIKAQSETKLKQLNDRLLDSKSTNEELSTQLSAAKHSVEISESRLENSNKFLDNARKEIEHSQKETIFWKTQASKQEDHLVKKSNELRDIEHKLSVSVSLQNTLQTEKEMWHRAQSSLSDEISTLKKDKDQLYSFVLNLQALLKEREASSTELSKKLSQSIENYQSLQEKINDKEDRIQTLSSQSDMALKAQNAKLEQVNELSQKLLDARSKISEKEGLIESLQNKLKSGEFKKSNSRLIPQDMTHVSERDGTPILISEYNDLKDALKAAEAQVDEFSSIAKSAEDALMKASASFDEFKESSSIKITLLEDEKNSLSKEAETQKQQILNLQHQLQEQGSKTSSEIQDLQTRLQEKSSKAESYDDMKLDYEKKIHLLTQDLNNQVSMSDDLQRRYEAKLSEADSLNFQISRQKEEINEHAVQLTALKSKLSEAEAELVLKEDRIKECLSGQQDDLQSTQIKLRDLQYQYDLALTQLELQKPSSESDVSTSNDDFRQVLSYLRAEKDSAESKAAVATDEVAQLKVQLESVSAEFEATKSQMSRLQSMKIELEDANNDHARLMEQLEQLNILRESNRTLRSENRSCLEKINRLEAEIEQISARAPENYDKMQVDVQAQELNLLREENDRLKNQADKNEELETLNQRFTRLKSEYNTKLSNHRNKNKELERQMMDIKLQLQKTEEELAKLKSTHNSVVDASSVTSQLEQSQKDKIEAEKKFTDEIMSLKRNFEKQKVDAESAFQAKLAEVTSTASSVGISETQIKEKINAEWKQKLEKATADLKNKFENDLSKAVEQRVQKRLSELEKDEKNSSEIQDRIKKEYETQIDVLNQNFEKRLADEKAGAKKAVGTMYELKLKMLNKKLEKYEKQKSGKSQEQKQENKKSVQNTPKNEVKGSQDVPSDIVQTKVGKISGEPSVEKPTSSPQQENDSGKKRPFSQGNPPNVTFKRSKD